MAGMGGIILYIIFLGALVYFMAIRPQKKERQKQQELLASVAVGVLPVVFYSYIVSSDFTYLLLLTATHILQ